MIYFIHINVCSERGISNPVVLKLSSEDEPKGKSLLQHRVYELMGELEGLWTIICSSWIEDSGEAYSLITQKLKRQGWEVHKIILESWWAEIGKRTLYW